MNDNSLTTTITVDETPQRVYDAVTDVRGWWLATVTGESAKTGDEFDYDVTGLHHATIRVTEAIPHRSITWQVMDNWFSFLDNDQEWTGTRIHFDISEQNGQTRLRFTHEGLLPEFECYEVCHPAWTFYIEQSLRDLITTGVGRPGGQPGQAEAQAAAQATAGAAR